MTMNLLQRIRLKLHKKPRLTESQESISTPLGHLPGDYRLTVTRLVNLDASLDEGVQRARKRNYAEGGKHDER